MIKKLNRRQALRTVLWTVLAVWIAGGPPAGTLAAHPESADGQVVFSFLAPDAKEVFLAGDFNGWSATGTPLARQDSGLWTVSVDLAPGAYEYKFVVDGAWVEDPDNPEKKSDPFGGSNSLVTVGPDGSVALAAGAAAGTGAASPADRKSAVSLDDIEVGRPRPVDGGILFTYNNPDATTVYLAGTFNGWNAQDLAMDGDDKGNFAAIVPLEAGEHEYKFVVDGGWFADPENPETKTDPYGGSNSVVNIGPDGQITAAAVAADDGKPGPNTNLNAKLYLGGRYLTRFEYAKNLAVEIGDDAAVDPRYRLQRPTQSVDLNFEAEVSELATTYMRLRLDSDQNIIQNNIAGFLDEANLAIEPHNFYLRAYWNQETYTSGDLLTLGGNIDLPGTIMHDHLDYGKGTAGALFDADPAGVKTVLFFANVHNGDYYNDPNLFDNTGEDKIGLRLSRKVGSFEIGAPAWIERSLVWLDFGTQVGLPSTGIPALDEYRANTGDSSTWYETENHTYNLGLDLRWQPGSRWMFGAQGNYVDLKQRIVTGNEAGQNNTNGSIDVPILGRDRRMYLGQIDWQPTDDMGFSLKHVMADMKGADPDQRFISYEFRDQTTANKNIYFTIEGSPASVESDSTDLTWNWTRDEAAVEVWLRRTTRDFDYGSSGVTVPEDTTLTARTEEILQAAVRGSLGRSGGFLGRGEVEFAYANDDYGAAGMTMESYEVILRWDRDLTRNTGLIADLRFIKYHVEGKDTDGVLVTENPDYFNPFAGFRYTPIKKLEVVLGYGVDPLDYSIDYAGRDLGRWWYRQNYLFDHPDATQLDAEEFLSDATVFTLRAQLQF